MIKKLEQVIKNQEERIGFTIKGSHNHYENHFLF